MGKTIIISSHILHELAQFCTRIGIVEAGKLVTEGSLDDIYKQLGLLQVIHVQVLNLDDSMIARIRGLPGVESADPQADRVAIRMRASETGAEVLLEDMMRVGCRIRMFQPEAMDMETAFMKLTEGKTA